ncbi:hypothetical protein HMPREF1210_01143 [Paenisporosarcina sp. HGH0030]|uniref:hypothetical protein n=1 Tax=Paenisporosarcina sp. HGH0030 TaxID=1078085 RepID=UPI00034E3E60|nr:hypothetical protein [Paenisporosarcina sp. HGH0030]EPD52763.1 hypothetical protein HMPREF1210_01143 [Paenisporosarcina sp. HGH0030]
MIVKVKEVPVRYNGQTYSPNEEFEMDKAHVNENIVEVVEDDEVNPFEKMTKDQLKAELDRLEISYEADAKKEVLVKALSEAPTE